MGKKPWFQAGRDWKDPNVGWEGLRALQTVWESRRNDAPASLLDIRAGLAMGRHVVY